ncbi:MAG: NTP transferase domain-containing protein [Cyanobacteria bacterium J06633_2]
MQSSPDQSPTPRSSIVSTFILAGGQSTRMGTDKASLLIDGVPMLRRVYDVAVQCTETVAIITPWPERYRSLVPDSCEWIVEVSPDEAGEASAQSCGPLMGFADGLNHRQLSGQLTPWVMLLACDLPCLDPKILRGWIDTLPLVDEGAIAALPRYPQSSNDARSGKHNSGQYSSGKHKQWEPLCGFYRASCFGSLQHFIDRGGRSFQQWLANESVVALEMSDACAQTMLINCNTPDDAVFVKGRPSKF